MGLNIKNAQAEAKIRELAALRDRIGSRRDAYEKEYQRTSQIIESRFDFVELSGDQLVDKVFADSFEILTVSWESEKCEDEEDKCGLMNDLHEAAFQLVRVTDSY